LKGKEEISNDSFFGKDIDECWVINRQVHRGHPRPRR